jgi:hypothetical protein
MTSPIHPNEFALRQEVLFREPDDPHWREGVITAISVDDTKTRDRHGDGCDEHLYVIADHAFDDMLRNERVTRTVTGCLCEVMVTSADSTGRWNGQQLGGAKGLALLLFDMERRGSYVELQPAIGTDHTDPANRPDRVMLMEVPGYHHLASATLDDLVAWASGIPATKWKEPTE